MPIESQARRGVWGGGPGRWWGRRQPRQGRRTGPMACPWKCSAAGIYSQLPCARQLKFAVQSATHCHKAPIPVSVLARHGPPCPLGFTMMTIVPLGDFCARPLHDRFGPPKTRHSQLHNAAPPQLLPDVVGYEPIGTRVHAIPTGLTGPCQRDHEAPLRCLLRSRCPPLHPERCCGRGPGAKRGRAAAGGFVASWLHCLSLVTAGARWFSGHPLPMQSLLLQLLGHPNRPGWPALQL